MHNRILFILILVCFQINAFAQSSDNIPYTRIGLGELYSHQNFQNIGMSGLGASACNGEFLNANNPATFGTFNYTNFETGIKANINNLSYDTITQSSSNVNVTGLVVGFPLRKRGGLVLGITPYSHVSYNLSTEIPNDSVIGTYYQRFEGSGNLYQIFAGVGRTMINKTRHQLAFGANAYYTFGNIKYNRYAEFPDTNLTYNTLNKVLINPRGFSMKAGVHYRHFLKDKEDITDKTKSFNVGATYTLGSKLNSEREEDWVRFRYNSNGTINYGIFAPDTIASISSITDTYQMPASFSFGANYMDLKNYTLGFNIQQTMWDQFRYNGQKNRLSSETKISLGGEVVSVSKKFKNRLAALYRAGVSYSTGYWEPSSGTKINRLSASLGVGIPIVRATRFNPNSFLNLALEVGTYGTNATKNEIKDNFVALHLGISLNEIWFKKSVID